MEQAPRRRPLLLVAAAALALLLPVAGLAGPPAARPAGPLACGEAPAQPSPEGASRRARLCGSAWRRPLSADVATRWRAEASAWGPGLGRPCAERPPSGGGLSKVESLAETEDFPARAGLTKVFYINMDSSTDRREFMEGQLNKSSVPFERFPAVDAQEIRDGKWDQYYIRNNITVCDRYRDQWGSTACALSHRLLWEKIAAEDPGGTGLYLTLEDDVLLPEGWEHMVSESVNVVPDDWTVVKLALWGRVDCSTMVNEFVALDTSPVWTEAPRGPPIHCRQRRPTPGGKCHQGTYWYAGSSANLVSPTSIPTMLDSIQWDKSCGSDWNIQSDGKHRSYVLVDPLLSARVRDSSGSVASRFVSARDPSGRVEAARTATDALRARRKGDAAGKGGARSEPTGSRVIFEHHPAPIGSEPPGGRGPQGAA